MAHDKVFDRILVTGATGQLGKAMVTLLGAHRCIAASRSVLPLDFPEALRTRLDYFKPTAIINCGAYTQVDRAELPEEKIFVQAVNEESPRVLAQWCAKQNVPLVHFSTDYVFDGSGHHARGESEPTAPLNTYGETKLAGEQAVLTANAASLIFRTSWVYDANGKNFLNTMLRLGAEKEELRVVADQIGAPTYAPHLAVAALEALERALELNKKYGRFPSGVYHLCAQGETSWHGFAEKIFQGALRRGATLRVQKNIAIPSSEYPTPARRPLNSRLDCSRAKEILGACIPLWENGLDECLDLKFDSEA
ncbi:dTDP-4-dehydrorhamnose reductase [bacterium]|nr:dTDP-4-dehydrorhamnose reductase [bacterium]